ncbi:choline/ethanolamine kinase family protein [uncultured Alsobacter sp.]|uniref:choline/ethanolamine kinase family protein n=1 Tax=uncultured Alsobacter sp. TaxID=1748258 RepID=UPI0025DAB425|nr:choline/ethanolamine kinase family protein [uncultured Alsobacter sp.]
MTDTLVARVRGLSCWQGRTVGVSPLQGGLSNEAFRVEDGAAHYVARLGGDIPAHHVFRDNEWAAARAAHAAGLSPELVHSEPGVSVFRFVAGRTWTEEDMRSGVERIVPLLHRCHREVGRRMTGPGRIFWVFHILRDYAAMLEAAQSPFVPELARWMPVVDRLEALQAPLPIVFGHHDLLPGNFIDDGDRLWLIDWEYGAFGTAMFDLANVATNAGLAPDAEERLLGLYFEREPDEALRVGFDAMKVASTLREAVWALVSGIHLRKPGVDYAGYATDYLARTERALAAFQDRHGPL